MFSKSNQHKNPHVKKSSLPALIVLVGVAVTLVIGAFVSYPKISAKSSAQSGLAEAQERFDRSEGRLKELLSGGKSIQETAAAVGRADAWMTVEATGKNQDATAAYEEMSLKAP